MTDDSSRKPLTDATASIEQYRAALSKVDDVRLVILLSFNAFEEAMRTLLAWRLRCHVDALPARLQPSLLFELTLSGLDSPKLATACRKFSELRNTVAHKFHARTWKPKLKPISRALWMMTICGICPRSTERTSSTVWDGHG